MNLPDRFTSKYQVDPETGCWEWQAALKTSGYAQFWNGTRMQPGHRFAYETVIGPVPEGLHLDHLCRNRICVNPLHVEPVTMEENIRRSPLNQAMWEAKRARTHCPHGHPFSPENTSARNDGWKGNPSRRCRACAKDAQDRFHGRVGMDVK
jgi:hypothetical protein